jgi:hypothetical protein
MEIQEALDIVRKLASGVHPDTGEAAASDSMYQHPRAVRATLRNRRARISTGARTHAAVSSSQRWQDVV